MFTSEFRVGLNGSGSAASIDFAKRAGVTHLRVGWDTNWGNRDDLVATVKRCADRGLRVDLSVVLDATQVVGGVKGRDYSDPRLLGFCTWAAQTLKPASIGLVNEGNHRPFVERPDANRWADCMVACDDAIRKVNPQILVVPGGLSTESGPLDPRQFLDTACRRQPSIRTRFPIFDMHAYEYPGDPRSTATWNPCDYLTDLDAIVGGVYWWISEFGCPAAGVQSVSGTKVTHTPEGQAEHLLRYVEAFARTPAMISRVHWFEHRDDKPLGESTNTHDYMGLCRNDGTPRESARLYRAWAWSRR